MLCTQIVVFVNFGTQHVLQMLRASEKDLPVINPSLLRIYELYIQCLNFYFGIMLG